MLSLLVTRKSEDPRRKTTLIVAPVALMRQWQLEIETKIKPSNRYRLTVFVHHGPSKAKRFEDLRHYDVVLTTYGSLAAELKKLENFELRKRSMPDTRPNSSERCALISPDAVWYRVILDEAQNIKNVNTQTAKAACKLDAIFRFCMTGTPMMNGVHEFYSLVKFLKIKPYCEWPKFRLDIAGPLKQSRGPGGRDRAMQLLQALCKAVMLRRTKKSTYEGQPILVLPERTTEVDNPEFCEDERKFYDSVEQKTKLQFNRYLRDGTVGSSYSQILVLLLRLRQACCHPHLLKDFGVAAAAGLNDEQLTNLAKELDPQVVERIKGTGGSFECPVCYDAVVNPAIFLPCGHDTCHECFARIADSSANDGSEAAGSAKCPTCRGPVDPKRITDFGHFKKLYMPDLLSAEEMAELQKMESELEAYAESETESDMESDDDDDDEVDANGNLKDFVVKDDEDIEVASAADESEGGSESKPPKSKGKEKKKKTKPKKGKGKKKEKTKKLKTMTLAEMKKFATRNAKARRAYMRRLRDDWMTSAKIEKTMERLREIMDSAEGEKVLVFSQWTSLLDLLEVPIDGEEWGYRRYDGSMNATMRNDAVDDFRDARKNVRIMLVSLKAGNAGLNLNMASQVIILDPFWNPYIEEQAIDRAHRLGQSRPVKVHRMLIENTVEDRIIELQEKKRALISEALDEKAGQNIARLGVQELAYLFGVTRNPSQRIQYVPRTGR
jgi:SNF2 family DNA or RNA helicase